MQNKKTAIINTNIFDGHKIVSQKNIVFENGIIISISNEVPDDAEIIDGK